MLYQSYRAKLDRRKRLFDAFWRFRLLFLMGFLLLLAAIGAMLGVAGMVSGDMVPAAVEYGEPLKATVKSVFNRKSGFEYRPAEGGEWSEDYPRTAGDYECRAYAMSVVGTKRYGEVHAFRIYPTRGQVRVLRDYLVYGETPEFVADLKYDDELRVYEYSSEEAGSRLEIVAETFGVFNAAGEDVTASYELSPVMRTVADRNRPVTVHTATQSFVYDGTPHSDGTLEFSQYGLARGHSFEAEFPALTDVGSQRNGVLSYRILDGDGEDVTEHYDLTFETGTVSVTPRKITVETDASRFVYDGAEHVFSGVRVEEGSLAGGQELSLAGLLSVTDAGTYTNAPRISVLAGKADVTRNYDITTVYGTVVCERRSLTVGTPSDTFIYDGQPRTYEERSIEAGTLAFGQELVLSGFLTVTDAGTYTNAPRIAVREGSADVTRNYEITPMFGTVTCERRRITVGTPSDTFVYDGQPRTYEERSIEAGTLAFGQELVLTNFLTVTDAGTYQNAPHVAISEGGRDVTRNYEITTAFGTVTCERRKITVRTPSDSFTYDGTAHLYEAADITDGELAEGQQLVLSATLSARDAGSYKNAPVLNVREGGIDRTRNYEISEDFGTVEVGLRPVGVVTLSQSFVYDAEAHSYPELRTDGTAMELAGGHSFEVTKAAEITDFGTAPNELSFRILDGFRRDATSNYSVSVNGTGTLTVDRRSVTLRSGSGTFEYDGTDHSVSSPESWVEENGTLVRGHFVRATVRSFRPVGVYDNTSSDRHILSSDGKDVTDNYEVVWLDGSVEIYSRAVTLLTGSGSFEYDAEPHGVPSSRAVSNTLAAGHTLEAVYPSLTERGTAQNTVAEGWRIRDGERGDVTSNYTITWEYGDLEITPRLLTVTTASGRWVYDAAPHEEGGYNVSRLVEGHSFSGEATLPTVLGKVTAENRYTFSSYEIHAGGRDVTRNYEIVSWVYGTLTVDPRPITVVTHSETFVYDGKPQVYAEAHPEYGDYPALGGHVVETDFGRGEGYVEKVNIGEYSNVCTAQIFDSAHGRADVTENYEISYRFGTVTVTQRQVNFRSLSQSFVYDAEPHAYPYAEVLGTPYGLADGHTFEVTSSTAFTDCDSGDNEVELRILDGSGEDVTYNYDVAVTEFGTVAVTPRPVSFLSGSVTAEYDAEFHSAPYADDLTAGQEGKGLVSWHRIVGEYPSWRDVSSNSNVPAEWHIEGDEDVTRNYTVSWEYGTVVIETRKVTLVTGTDEFTYDAQPHRVTNYYERRNTLVAGHVIRADESVYPTRTEFGTTENIWDPDALHVYDGETDVTENYELTWTYGNIVINKRPIFVTTDTMSWEYDAKEHTQPTFGECENLVEGHSFTAEVSSPTSVKNKTEDTPNEMQFDVWTVRDGGGGDVTGNYELQISFGTLSVTPRPIYITTGTSSWVYDGEPHSDRSYTYENLIEGHNLEMTILSSPSLTDVGTIRNLIMEDNYILTITDENGEDVTDNYADKGNRDFGFLTVTSRPLTVTTGDGSWVYDGDTHTCDEYTLDWGEYGELEGFTVTPAMTGFRDAGTYPNTVQSISILDRRSSPVSLSNFALEYREEGTVTVGKRAVTLSLLDGEWVYDGEMHSADFTWEEQAEERGLVSGHTVSRVESLSVREITDTDETAIYVPNEYLGTVVILDAYGNNVEDNYEVAMGEIGTLRVKSPIVIQLFSLTKPYDGEPLTYREDDWFLVKKPPDVEREWIHVTLGGSITAVGALSLDEVRALCSGTVSDGDNDYTAANRFDFEGSETPLRVNKRVLRIKTNSLSLEKGEEPFVWSEENGPGYRISYGSLLSDHHLECRATGVLDIEQETAENTLSEVHIYDAEGNDVSEYYEVQVSLGTLSWVPEDTEEEIIE